MRVAMERSQSAVASALSYEEASQGAPPEPYTGSIQSSLIEQAACGGQRAALRWNSEYRLLLAVLQDAVTCWFRYCRAQGGRERRMFQEIYEWFWDKNRDWLYAFESICEYLDLDPDAIRRGLVRWQATPLQQPMSVFQMRRVRRHRKIRPLYDSDEEEEF
jgi:hypothetical protein